ncbi:MAG TPA: nuclear transport factor 2 family protein [Candidatus Angelobacter sp.]|nr:nuclear transport factor 2 family protein [Candidatus Angelobacter sp.]
MIQPFAAMQRLNRNLRFLMPFVVIAFFSCAGPPKHPSWKNATGGEQHEKLMWRAIHDKDWKAVERHLAPSFVGVNAAGQSFNRESWLEYWKGAPVGEFSLGEMTVEPEGADMVVTYVLQLSSGSVAAETSSKGLRVIAVWQQVKTRWILTTVSLTPVQ